MIEPDDRLVAIIRFDSIASATSRSCLPVVDALSAEELEFVLDLNRARLAHMNISSSDAALGRPAVSASGEWDLEWSKSRHGVPCCIINGRQNGPSVVNVFVDGLLLCSRHVEASFSIRIRKVRRLEPGHTIFMTNREGVILYRGEGKWITTPTFRNGRARRDLKKAIVDGLYLSKKDTLIVPDFSREEMKHRYFLGYQFLRSLFRKVAGYDLIVSHGTLLGIVRDGDLIENDDDFDCAYISAYTRLEDVFAELAQIADQFRGMKLPVSVSLTGHMKIALGDCDYDVMPAWHDGRHFFISSYTALEIGLDRLLPLRDIRHNGMDIMAVQHPDLFLSLNYGPSWKVPDPNYRSRPNELVLRNRKSFERLLFQLRNGGEKPVRPSSAPRLAQQ